MNGSQLNENLYLTQIFPVVLFVLRYIKLLVMHDILKLTYIGMRNIQFVTNVVYVKVEWLSFEGGY